MGSVGGNGRRYRNGYREERVAYSPQALSNRELGSEIVFDVITGGSGLWKRGATELAGEESLALVKTETQFSQHSLERLAERGVTQDMAKVAIRTGQKFYDPLNKSINYVLPKGFASGKSLLVGTNPLSGQITTVIRSSKNLINARFISVP